MLRVRRCQLYVLSALAVAVATLVAFAQDQTTGQGNETTAQTEQGDPRFNSARRIELHTADTRLDRLGFYDARPVAMRGYHGKIFILFHEVTNLSDRPPIRGVIFETVDLVRGESEGGILFEPDVVPTEISPSGKYLAGVTRRIVPAEFLVLVWQIADGTAKTICEFSIPTKTFIPSSSTDAVDPSRLRAATPEFIDDDLLAIVVRGNDLVHYAVYRISGSKAELAYRLTSQIRPLLSPDRKQLAVVKNNHVLIFDPRTGKQLKTLRGEVPVPATLAFHPSGAWLAASSKDEYRVWDVRAGRPALYATGASSWGPRAIWLYDTFIFTMRDQELVLIDARTGAALQSYRPKHHDTASTAPPFSHSWHPFYAGLFWYVARGRVHGPLFLVGIPLPEQKLRTYVSRIAPETVLVLPVGEPVRLIIDSDVLTDRERQYVRQCLTKRLYELRIPIVPNASRYVLRVSVKHVGTKSILYYLEMERTGLFSSGSKPKKSYKPSFIPFPSWQIKVSLENRGVEVWTDTFTSTFSPDELRLEPEDDEEDAKRKMIAIARQRAIRQVCVSPLPKPSKLYNTKRIYLGMRNYGVGGLD